MQSIRYSCQILTKLDFSPQKCETEVSNFMKIRPVGTELFHVGGRADMKKLITAFHNFANGPKTQNLSFWE